MGDHGEVVGWLELVCACANVLCWMSCGSPTSPSREHLSNSPHRANFSPLSRARRRPRPRTKSNHSPNQKPLEQSEDKIQTCQKYRPKMTEDECVQHDHVLPMYHLGYHRGHRQSSIRELQVESATSITVEHWRLQLSEFRFREWTRSGREQHSADAMSRLPTLAPDRSVIAEEVPCLALAEASRGWVAANHGEPDKDQPVTLVRMLAAQNEDQR